MMGRTRGLCGRRRAMVLAVVLLALGVVFGFATVADAGFVTNWYGIQPTGTVGTGVPVIAQGTGAYDGYPLVSSSAKLSIDGVLVPRSSYSASVSSASVSFYYKPTPKLTDGVHTFRVEVSDSAGRLSFKQWSATVTQPPSASWITPYAGAKAYTGLPTITMSLADNTPTTTFTVAGQIRTGSAVGPVAATFGGSGLPSGTNAFTPSAELRPGSYYLTATVTDAAGNTFSLTGTSARSFTTAAVAAMTILESCDACHPTYRAAHATPAETECVLCHVGYDGWDHAEGSFCEDCHWEGWHNGGAGESVAITGACVGCHGPDRADLPRHTAASVAAGHWSACSDGCHEDSLLAQHADLAEGSAYSLQCDVCHGSADPATVAAIASWDGTCVQCHTDYHADFEAKHTSPTTACEASGCHASSRLVDAHTAYVGPTGRYPQYEDTCALCHTNEDPARVPAGATAECATCHPDRVAFHGYDQVQHTAVLGSGTFTLFASHDGVTDAYADCAVCHNAALGPVHAGLCSTCHPAPRGTFTDWGGSCSQGGCHPTYHASGFLHDGVANGNCTACHDDGSYTLYDDPCVVCHARPDAGDAIAPLTTANVLPAYIGIARVAFDVSDDDKVAIARTFHRIDGSPPTSGDLLDVATPGAHTLEYWSVDQFGNEELPHKTATFTVAADTTPPVTTSNAQAAYVGPASITLVASDASFLGVKGTYYTLNGGAVQTGTTISIAQPASGTLSYTLEFWSDDYSGNVEVHHAVTFTVTCDTTPPVSTFAAQPYYRTSTVAIPFTATDSGSGVQAKYYRVDGGAPVQHSITSGTLIRTFTTQGPHTVEYWAVDKVGNTEVHRFATFTVDWTVPTVTSNAISVYPATGANITITAVDQPSNGASPPSVRYRLDGGAEVVAGPITTVSVTALGLHGLEFWAVDLAGNTSAHTTVAFTVGSGGPPSGTGTIRLIWGDGSGVPPYSSADWTVRTGSSTGPVVASGSGNSGPDGTAWDGIDDIIVTAQADPYWVGIEWYDDEWGDGTSVFFPVWVTASGQVVELHY